MEKVANMTSKQMREYRTKNKDNVKGQLEAAPEFTNEEMDVDPGL